MLELLQLPFMQRAIAAGLVLAALLALLGPFVLLRRMGFFASGLAHASLAGVAIGIVLSVNPLMIAIVFSVLFALLIYWLEQHQRLASDTSISILFASGMAFGVLLISLQPGYQPELMSFLFGNILAISRAELWLMLGVGALVVVFLMRSLPGLIMLSLDREMAYTSGVRIRLLQPALYVILAVTVVLGIKVLGVVLVTALLAIPTAIAKAFARSFSRLLTIGVIVAEVIVIAGILLSYWLDLPTGPTIVLTGTILFTLTALTGRLRG